MKNIKHLGLLLAIHFAGFFVTTLILELVFDTDIIPALLPQLWFILPYIPVIITVFLVYKKCFNKEDYNRIMLPLSFVIFPVFNYFATITVIQLGRFDVGNLFHSETWLWTFLFNAVFVSLPFAIITFILATKKPKHGSA